MCKISVITPVYNVEDYLEKCIDSILKQTIEDFELIIVDDGSTDRCSKIADNYRSKDERIIVIHKVNGGAPSARNEGIKIAKGKYMYFPDSDDWLENDYLEKMYNTAEQTNVSLVISGFTMEYYTNGKRQMYSVSVPEKVFDNKASVRDNIHNYFDNMMVAVPWNKLYRSDYIRENKLMFPNLKWDDLHFNMEVLKDINSVAISDAAGYHFFRTRAGSETTKVFDGMLYQKRRQQFLHILKVYKYWNKGGKEISSTLYAYYSKRLLQCIEEISISDKTIEEKKNLIGEILDDSLNQKAFKYGQIDSKLMRIAMAPTKLDNVELCLVDGYILGFVKNNMTEVFNRLKSKIINKAKVEDGNIR